MSKHTPGPWVAARRDEGIGDVQGLKRISIGQPIPGSSVWFEKTVCWIIPDAFGAAPHEANANLIAAAPDLLEACKAMLDRFGIMSDDCILMANDAVSKAEGRKC